MLGLVRKENSIGCYTEAGTGFLCVRVVSPERANWGICFVYQNALRCGVHFGFPFTFGFRRKGKQEIHLGLMAIWWL